MLEKFRFDGSEEPEGRTEMGEIASEAYQTTADVLEYLHNRVEQVKDPITREDLEQNISQWGTPAQELFGLFLENLDDIKSEGEGHWDYVVREATKEKRVPLEYQQLLVMARMLDQIKNPKKVSQAFQRAARDLEVPREAIFRGELREE